MTDGGITSDVMIYDARALLLSFEIYIRTDAPEKVSSAMNVSCVVIDPSHTMSSHQTVSAIYICSSLASWSRGDEAKNPLTSSFDGILWEENSKNL